MKKGRKIILFLVEGASDCTSLEFIENINEDETIKFQITSGDITSKLNITPQNCIIELNSHLNNFIKKNKLKKTDIVKIIHILDTDGAYIPDDKIVEKTDIKNFLYSTEGIIANSKRNVEIRNKNKREILEKLLKTSMINSISYKIYYMSCNLEHVLHNKLENLTDDEKKELANQFADKFYEKEYEFVKFINNSDFKVLGNYEDTWDFIKKDLNSVNRYSNFWLFFDGLCQMRNRDK